MFKFTVSQGQKAGACAADTDCRYAMNGVAILPGQEPLIAATDGRALSIVRASGQSPEKPMLLPAAAVNANGKEANVEVNGEVRATAGSPLNLKSKTAVYPLPEQTGRFPAIRQVIPDPETMDSYLSIPLDAKLLAKIASAVCAGNSCQRVRLFIDQTREGNAIVIVGFNEEERTGLGILMPLCGGSKDDLKAERERDMAYIRAMRYSLPESTIEFGK